MHTIMKISAASLFLLLLLIGDIPLLPVHLVPEAQAIFGVRRRTAIIAYSAGRSREAAMMSQQQAAAAQQQTAAANQQAAEANQQAAEANKQAAQANQQAAYTPPPAPAAAPGFRACPDRYGSAGTARRLRLGRRQQGRVP